MVNELFNRVEKLIQESKAPGVKVEVVKSRLVCYPAHQSLISQLINQPVNVVLMFYTRFLPFPLIEHDGPPHGIGTLTFSVMPS